MLVACLNSAHTRSVQVPFSSEKHAQIAKRSIEVDPELQAHAVKRTISVEGNVLHACVSAQSKHFRLAYTLFPVSQFSTLTVRLARLSVNAFLENVDLVIRTIAQFGQEAEQRPT